MSNVLRLQLSDDFISRDEFGGACLDFIKPAFGDLNPLRSNATLFVGTQAVDKIVG